MKYFLLFVILLMMSGCSPKLRQSFSKISSPEKTWVIFHLLKAKKALAISKDAEKITDSISKTGSIGHDNNGGHLDAFKHSFWMATLTQGIGKRAAFSLGKAHEKGNYKAFKKRKLEEGYLPDKQSTEMDLFNNIVGINIGETNRNKNRSEIIQKIVESLKKGHLKVLLKDNEGNFLNCQNNLILQDSLLRRWETKKCLVFSNKTSF